MEGVAKEEAREEEGEPILSRLNAAVSAWIVLAKAKAILGLVAVNGQVRRKHCDFLQAEFILASLQENSNTTEWSNLLK